MAINSVKSVSEYLHSLSADQGSTIEALRELILKHLPKGYKEVIQYGMISYWITLATYPDTYNKQPLAIISLGAKKNYYTLHLVGGYNNSHLRSQLENRYKVAGKKLDMGAGCLRFKNIEDLCLEAIAEVIASVSVEQYIAAYESVKKKKK